MHFGPNAHCDSRKSKGENHFAKVSFFHFNLPLSRWSPLIRCLRWQRKPTFLLTPGSNQTQIYPNLSHANKSQHYPKHSTFHPRLFPFIQLTFTAAIRHFRRKTSSFSSRGSILQVWKVFFWVISQSLRALRVTVKSSEVNTPPSRCLHPFLFCESVRVWEWWRDARVWVLLWVYASWVS